MNNSSFIPSVADIQTTLNSVIMTWVRLCPMSNNPPSVRLLALERGREGWAGIWSALVKLHGANLYKFRRLCKFTDSNQACCKNRRCFSALLCSCQLALAVGERWRRRWLGGVSQLKFKGLSRSLRTDWCVVLTALRRSGGQDSAEREQVSPGLLFALKLNSVGWGFHRHQECIVDAFAEQGVKIADFFGTEKKFLHRRLQVTPIIKVRTSAKVSTYCKQTSAKVSTYNRL